MVVVWWKADVRYVESNMVELASIKGSKIAVGSSLMNVETSVKMLDFLESVWSVE